MRTFQIYCVYNFALVLFLANDSHAQLYVSNLEFYLNQYINSGVTLVLDTSRVSFHPPNFPIFVTHVPAVGLNSYLFRHLGSASISYADKRESLNSISQFRQYAFLFLLYDHKLVSNEVCHIHYPYSKYMLAEVLIFSANSTFQYGCRGSPIFLDSELDNNGYEHKVIRAFLNSDFTNCSLSDLGACFQQQMQYSRGGVKGSPSRCRGKNEKLITTSEIHKYIGSPFHMKDLSNSLSKYLEKSTPRFSFIKAPEPINVLLYATLVNLIERTNGCIVTSVNNNSADFLYYRHLPHMLKTDSHGLSVIADDYYYHPKDLWKIEHIVLTGMRYMQFATCDGVKMQMPFDIYIKTYDFSSWLWLLFYAFFLVPISVVLILFIKKVPNKDLLHLCGQIFSSSISSLLEVPPHFNESTLIKLKTRHLVRVTYGIWLLALVVIINAYKGLFTSFVLAPLKPTHSWNKLSQLDNFFVWNSHISVVAGFAGDERNAGSFDPILCECTNKIGIPPHSRYIYEHEREACTRFPPYEKALSQHITMETDYYAKHFNNCAEYSATTITSDPWGHLKPSMAQDKSLKFRQRLLPKNGLIFRGRDIRPRFQGYVKRNQRSFMEYLPILMMCDKTAFIETEINVKAFVVEAQYGSIESKNGEYFTAFSTGDSGFLPMWTGLEMLSRIRESYPIQLLRQKLYLQLLYFQQHGIIQVWDKWHSILFAPINDLRKKQSAIEEFQRQPKKLKLGLNVASMFLIWSVGLVLCVIIFVGEIIHSYIMITMELYYTLKVSPRR